MPDAVVNFGYGTVATAPSPATSGTSMVLASGQGSWLPVAPFNATVQEAGIRPDPTNAEIIRVTAVVGDTITCTRAQEGTTARTVIVGDLVYASITAKTLTDMQIADHAFETEIDFGALPCWSKQFVITDARVLSTSLVTVLQSNNVATGRIGDDAEWDQLMLSARAQAGQFTVTCCPHPGPIVGKRKILYGIS